MRLNKFFFALCAFAVLGVSCQKENLKTVNTANVPEGMKIVSFTVGMDTRISGGNSDKNPIVWNSSAEDVAVLAKLGGVSKTYHFKTEAASSTQATKKISGIVDNDAELLYVVSPYIEGKFIPTLDADNNIILPEYPQSFSYAKANGVPTNAPFACRIVENGGTYEAVGTLKSLFSYLNVILPERATDATSGMTEKPTSYAKTVKITGIGVGGEVKVVDLVTSPSEDAAEKTISALVKTNTQSNLPEIGSHLIPIVPGTFSQLTFTVIYTPGTKGGNYADYVETYDLGEVGNPAKLEQGKYYKLELSGPWVKSVSTSAATFNGNELAMTGAADLYVGGKVTVADNYDVKFLYREKNTTEWLVSEAEYSDGAITATETLDASKTYEVKAVAVAKNALLEEGIVDQVIEGEVVESKAHVEPMVVTIDKFPQVEYDGTEEGGNWKYVGDRTGYTFPKAGKFTGDGSIYVYDYYAKTTDTTPLMSGIAVWDNKAGYCFKLNDKKDPCFMLYGGYIEIPGKAGYKITSLKVKLSAGSGGRIIRVASTSTSTYSETKSPLGSVTYSNSDKTLQELVTAVTGAGAGAAIRLCPNSALYIGLIEITYTPVD